MIYADQRTCIHLLLVIMNDDASPRAQREEKRRSSYSNNSRKKGKSKREQGDSSRANVLDKQFGQCDKSLKDEKDELNREKERERQMRKG